jgi:hypothetical protein
MHPSGLHVLLTQAPRSCRVSLASKLPDAPEYRLRHARPSGSVLRPKPRNPPPMVLWPNHQTPRRLDRLLSLASFLDLATTDAPAPCPRLHLALLAPCGSHLIPSATWSIEPSLLVSPLLGGPAMLRPFAPVLHLHQRKPSRNQHVQY